MYYSYDGYPEHECRLTFKGLKHPYCCYENNEDSIEEETDIERIKKWSIDLLNMPTKTNGALRRNGIGTVGQLVACSREKLLTFRSLGETAINNIVIALTKIGLKLAEPTPEDFPKKKKEYHYLPREGPEFDIPLRSDI